MFVLARDKHTGERPFFLTNFQLMQANKVMPHMIELELLKGRDDLFAIVPLMENTES